MYYYFHKNIFPQNHKIYIFFNIINFKCLFNKNDDSKEFDFTTNHILKTNRYLKLPIKDNKVLNYEKFTSKDLVDKIKEKLT